jgi:hypothetical protein
VLNRSTDGGKTWNLGGSNLGLLIANTDTIQPTPKFCTVNALLGGIDHIAVDPTNGDVLYVYGKLDPGHGNQLMMRRLREIKGQVFRIGNEKLIAEAGTAIPSVAVTDDDSIGIFYYSCDGIDASSGFPAFTAHFDISVDGGQTLIPNDLASFLSAEKDNGNQRQRILGDYMQTKAVGSTFYGGFVANGLAFGRTMVSNDPIFFSVSVDPQTTTISRR